MAVELDFLGNGWAFPLATEPDGDVAMSAYEKDVREAVQLILATEQGERVMRPDFGAGLGAFAFAPLSATTIALVRHRVEQALVAWEPRIDVDSVDVGVDRETPGRLNVEIRYRIRATNTFYNLVYPFYLFEGERP